MEFACPPCGKTAFRLMTPTEEMFYVAVAKTSSE